MQHAANYMQAYIYISPLWSGLPGLSNILIPHISKIPNVLKLAQRIQALEKKKETIFFFFAVLVISFNKSSPWWFAVFAIYPFILAIIYPIIRLSLY